MACPRCYRWAAALSPAALAAAGHGGPAKPPDLLRRSMAGTWFRPARRLAGCLLTRSAPFGGGYVPVGAGTTAGVLGAAADVPGAAADALGAGGTVVADGVADGEVVVGTADGLGDGEDVADVGVGVGFDAGVTLCDRWFCWWCAGRAGLLLGGPTRFGVCTCPLGVSSSSSAPTTTAATATTPPAAAPAANARRSRWDSVRRRSRSHCGSEARCAAQLLNGAAAMPSVGKTSMAASSGAASAVARDTARPMPRKPSTASVDSAQFARSASHHLACSLVFGVRRKAALRANRPSTDARATTREVDCQMKNAPSASRQFAPVPRRSSATARTSPSPTSTGTVASRNGVSLRNSSPPPLARFTAPASRKTKKIRPSRSPYHWTPPAR